MVLETMLSSLPVSTSVMLILYPLMTPFWLSRGGGVHKSLRVVESLRTAFRFCGAEDGTVEPKFSVLKISNYVHRTFPGMHTILWKL